MASCQPFYYNKARKGKVWEDLFFVITGQEYLFNTSTSHHEKSGKYDSIGAKKEKKYVYA